MVTLLGIDSNRLFWVGVPPVKPTSEMGWDAVGLAWGSATRLAL